MKQKTTNENEIKEQWTRMDIERYPNLYRFVVSRMETMENKP
jgi:hypothetical protein